MQFVYTFLVLMVLGIVFGLGLSLANKYLTVKEDPRITDIEAMLPGYNCGACGTAGCHAFAEAVIEKKITELTKCRPGKKDIHFLKIQEYLKNHPSNDGVIEVKI